MLSVPGSSSLYKYHCFHFNTSKQTKLNLQTSLLFPGKFLSTKQKELPWLRSLETELAWPWPSGSWPCSSTGPRLSRAAQPRSWAWHRAWTTWTGAPPPRRPLAAPDWLASSSLSRSASACSSAALPHLTATTLTRPWRWRFPERAKSRPHPSAGATHVWPSSI